MRRSSGALAFLEDHLERSVLAEVDEVVRGRIGLRHFGEVRQERLDAREGHTREELLR